MLLPPWVQEIIRGFDAPATGKVLLTMEVYQGGVTKVEIGGVVRRKPPEGGEKQAG